MKFRRLFLAKRAKEPVRNPEPIRFIVPSKAGVLPGKIVRGGDVYWGVPVRPLREYKRLNALFGRLPEMKADLDALKKEVIQLRQELQKK